MPADRFFRAAPRVKEALRCRIAANARQLATISSQVYVSDTDVQEKLVGLEEMLQTIPKHKGTDHLQADLKRRLSRLRQDQEQDDDLVAVRAPDAYETASVPVTAFMATVVKAGALLAAVRLFAQTPLSSTMVDLLAILPLVSIVWGNLAAIRQTSFRRMIAYSSIAHMGFVTLGAFAAYQIFASTGSVPGTRRRPSYSSGPYSPVFQPQGRRRCQVRPWDRKDGQNVEN